MSYRIKEDLDGSFVVQKKVRTGLVFKEDQWIDLDQMGRNVSSDLFVWPHKYFTKGEAYKAIERFKTGTKYYYD